MDQLQIQAACDPVPFGEGLQTLACAGTLRNPGPELLHVVAIGVVPGQSSAVVDEYDVPAGAAVELPAPPQGGVWVIGAQTAGQINRRSDWAIAGAVGVGALAGIGAADALVGLYRLIRRR